MSESGWTNSQRGRHGLMAAGGPDPAPHGWRDYIYDPEFNRERGSSRGQRDRVLFSRPTQGVSTAPALWVVDVDHDSPVFFDGQGERDDYDWRKPPKTKAAIVAYVVKFLAGFASPDKVLSGEWFWTSGIAREIRDAVITSLRKKGYKTTVPNAPHLETEIR